MVFLHLAAGEQGIKLRDALINDRIKISTGEIIRLVLHRDIDDADLEYVVAALLRYFQSQ